MRVDITEREHPRLATHHVQTFWLDLSRQALPQLAVNGICTNQEIAIELHETADAIACAWACRGSLAI